jgi:hypothetical protein
MDGGDVCTRRMNLMPLNCTQLKMAKMKPGTEAHIYIPATQEAEIRRIVTQGQPRQKKSKKDPISITTKLGVVAHIYYPSCGEGISKRISVQANPYKKHETLSEK